MIARVPLRWKSVGSSIAGVRPRKVTSADTPVLLSSIVTRSVRIGSTIWSSNGPTRISVRSAGQRREPRKLSWVPSARTMLSAQSITSRLGYTPSATPK